MNKMIFIIALISLTMLTYADPTPCDASLTDCSIYPTQVFDGDTSTVTCTAINAGDTTCEEIDIDLLVGETVLGSLTDTEYTLPTGNDTISFDVVNTGVPYGRYDVTITGTIDVDEVSDELGIVTIQRKETTTSIIQYAINSAVEILKSPIPMLGMIVAIFIVFGALKGILPIIRL